MNEEQKVNPTPKPKKKRSFWWLKLLLVLILFAAGIIAGLMLSSQAMTQQLIGSFFPQYTVEETLVAPAPTEAPVEYKAAESTPTVAPTKAPVEIVSPELEEKKAEEKADEAPAEEGKADKKDTDSEADKQEKTEAAAPSEKPAAELIAPVIAETAAPTAKTELIGIDAALKAALDHAGFDEKDVFVYGVSRERDDGLVLYEVEFGYNGKEYDYEINAYTAAVEGWKTERDSDNVQAVTADTAVEDETPGEYLSLEQAKKIALDHCGYDDGGADDLTIELELYRGKLVYDIEFWAEGYEYEYKIDAENGNIVSREKDIDR